MSWSANFRVKNHERVKESIFESNVEVAYSYDQYVQAVLAAHTMIDSGVLGDPDGEYAVTLSGHGNPDHVPTVGWSLDYVTVNIAQVSAS